jgi:hypothetical protein
LRVWDTSAITRESALDLIALFIGRGGGGAETKYRSSGSVQKMYVPMVMERAGDPSIGVRKKVVNILSSILNYSGDDEGEDDD